MCEFLRHGCKYADAGNRAFIFQSFQFWQVFILPRSVQSQVKPKGHLKPGKKHGRLPTIACGSAGMQDLWWMNRVAMLPDKSLGWDGSDRGNQHRCHRSPSIPLAGLPPISAQPRRFASTGISAAEISRLPTQSFATRRSAAQSPQV